TVKENNGALVINKIDNTMMNLHSKTYLELNKDELQREIDYLWGQYDYVTHCEFLPEDFKEKQEKYLWKQISLFTTRYISLVVSYVNDVREGRDR
ncbi:hypothetical protein, partial [Anaerosporobacter sp.]